MLLPHWQYRRLQRNVEKARFQQPETRLLGDYERYNHRLMHSYSSFFDPLCTRKKPHISSLFQHFTPSKRRLFPLDIKSRWKMQMQEVIDIFNRVFNSVFSLGPQRFSLLFPVYSKPASGSCVRSAGGCFLYIIPLLPPQKRRCRALFIRFPRAVHISGLIHLHRAHRFPSAKRNHPPPR